MRELLESLGWADSVINGLEIGMYVILILSGLIAILVQTKKMIVRLIPKFKNIKTIKGKLKAFKAFSKWYIKAVKDGVIDDAEIDSINNEFDIIINSFDTKEDVSNNSVDKSNNKNTDEVGKLV